MLALKCYRQFWGATLFVRLAEAVGQVALPLLLYAHSHSAGQMSAILALQMLPQVLLAPVTGLLADRLDRRWMMIGTSAVRAGGAALIPLVGEPWQVAALVACAAVSTALNQPVELAVLPTTVPPEDRVPALGLALVTAGAAKIIGPAVGVGLVGAVGLMPVFWLQAACFAAGAGGFWRLALPRHVAGANVRGRGRRRFPRAAWEEFVLGLRTVWRTPATLGCITTAVLWTSALAASSIAAVVYTRQTLWPRGHAEVTYGLLATTLNAGVIVGALTARRGERRVGQRRLLAIGSLAPLALVPAALVPRWPILFACWFALGLTYAWVLLTVQANVAEAVPDTLQGRVHATLGGVGATAALSAYALAGWLTNLLGALTTLALAGLMAGLGGPALLRLSGGRGLAVDGHQKARGPGHRGACPS